MESFHEYLADILCTMLLASPIPSLVLPVSIAQAETPVFVGGLQDLLLGEPSIADGATQATYYFVLLNADGSPMEGVSGKTSLGSAKGTLKSEGNGLYSTILTPKPSHLQPMTCSNQCVNCRAKGYQEKFPRSIDSKGIRGGDHDSLSGRDHTWSR